MRVVSVAYPFAPVRDDTAGGAEQILRLIDADLVARGETSIVVACEGSAVRGELVALPAPPHVIDDRERQWRLCREAIANVDADVVQYHGVDFASYFVASKTSHVTLHLPLDHYSSLPPSASYNCVSHSQRGGKDFAVIANGIDLSSTRFRDTKEDYLLAAGRICEEKGFHVALDAARIAGAPMLLAGTVHPYAAHREYFERAVLPRLDTHRRFIGAVGGAAKRELFARARAVVIPSLIDETSSLVAMEALASGTPVIAFARGALPEIVEHGVTGFLVADVREMAAAIRAVWAIDPRTCRDVAHERFTSRRMLDEYAALFARLTSPPRLRPS